MMKKFALAIVAVLFAGSAFAQSALGVKGGLNLAQETYDGKNTPIGGSSATFISLRN
jgi:uncharacterized protein YdeI (BOF family)